MWLITRYSCGHISGPHELIYVKFGVWRFFTMIYWNMVIAWKCWNAKTKIWWRDTSVLYRKQFATYNVIMSWATMHIHFWTPCKCDSSVGLHYRVYKSISISNLKVGTTKLFVFLFVWLFFLSIEVQNLNVKEWNQQSGPVFISPIMNPCPFNT